VETNAARVVATPPPGDATSTACNLRAAFAELPRQPAQGEDATEGEEEHPGERFTPASRRGWNFDGRERTPCLRSSHQAARQRNNPSTMAWTSGELGDMGPVQTRRRAHERKDGRRIPGVA